MPINNIGTFYCASIIYLNLNFNPIYGCLEISYEFIKLLLLKQFHIINIAKQIIIIKDLKNKNELFPLT